VIADGGGRTRAALQPIEGSEQNLSLHPADRDACTDCGMELPDQPTEYEQMVALASRLDQLLVELEGWLHVRERLAAKGGARTVERAWRSRRLAVVRYSQALLAALLRDVEL
jgi:hypothetical protein